jgi:hypothetical protein
MVLPDGPRDMEALFVLPGEELYFITKGRSHPVTVYRYPPPLRAGETVTLEEVQTLTEGPVAIPYQVTGADASPDGRLVAVRTYESLTFYRMSRGRLVPLRGAGWSCGPWGRPRARPWESARMVCWPSPARRVSWGGVPS